MSSYCCYLSYYVISQKLTELGPRLKLELFKVERNVCEGEVIYHKYLHKSAEEASAQQTRIDKERALKQQRRMQQEDNVKRKRELLEAKKEEQVKKRSKRDTAYSPNPSTGASDSDKKGAKHGRDDESDGDDYDDDGDDEGNFDAEDDEEEEEE